MRPENGNESNSAEKRKALQKSGNVFFYRIFRNPAMSFFIGFSEIRQCLFLSDFQKSGNVIFIGFSVVFSLVE